MPSRESRRGLAERGPAVLDCGQGMSKTEQPDLADEAPEPKQSPTSPGPPAVPPETSRGRLLIVDDKRDFLTLTAEAARSAGYEVMEETTATGALARLDRGEYPDLALLDVRLGQMDGIELSRQMRARVAFPIVMMSGFGSIEMAVRAIREGASDFLMKPFTKDLLLMVIERVQQTNGLIRENARLRTELSSRADGSSIIGNDPRIMAVLRLVREFAASTAPVLITGETGTGKEMVAHEIHQASPRSNGPFIAVNCAAVPEELFESEFFGHEKGAFTGATSLQTGRLESASGGSLFLDEIGSMPLRLQSKLLRVLQDHEFERVGSRVTRKVDFRLLAATNEDLEEAIRQKRFREDLYYRIRVLPIHLPPLRERREDIPLLATHFLRLASAKSSQPPKTLGDAALLDLLAYPWPGNVRELASVMEQASVLTPGQQVLSVRLGSAPAPLNVQPFDVESAASRESFERRYLHTLFTYTRGNLRMAAKVSGLSRRHLQRMRARYGLDLDSYDNHSAGAGDESQ